MKIKTKGKRIKKKNNKKEEETKKMNKKTREKKNINQSDRLIDISYKFVNLLDVKMISIW